MAGQGLSLCVKGVALTLTLGLAGCFAEKAGVKVAEAPAAKTCPASTSSSKRALAPGPYKTDFRYQQMSFASRVQGLLSNGLLASGSDASLLAGHRVSLGVRRACFLEQLETHVRSQADLLTFEDLAELSASEGARGVVRARLARDVSVLELEDRVRRLDCVRWLADDSEATRSRVGAYFEAPAAGESPGKNPYLSHQKYVPQLEAAEAFEYFYHAEKGIKAEVVIGVVDSGIRTTHVEFREGAGGVARDVLWKRPGTNTVGYSAFGTSRSAEDTAPSNHGTKVSGVIAMAHDNSRGGAGLTLSHVKIMPLQFIQASAGDPMGQSGYSSDRQKVLELGLDSGALDVLNFSFASSSPQQSFLDEILEATTNRNIFIAAASGNEAANMDSTPSYPAAWGPQVPGLMSVGGTAEDDTSARWYGTSGASAYGANYSPTLVEIAAPAEGVFTTAGYLRDDSMAVSDSRQYTDYGYAISDGTSFATPMVTAAAALVIGMLKTHGIPYTAGLVEEILADGAKVSASLKPYFRGGRRLSLLGVAEVMKLRYPQTDPNAKVSAPAPASTTTSCP